MQVRGQRLCGPVCFPRFERLRSRQGTNGRLRPLPTLPIEGFKSCVVVQVESRFLEPIHGFGGQPVNVVSLCDVDGRFCRKSSASTAL